MEWKIKKIKVNELKEFENNPRVLTKKGLEDLTKSITKFGLAEPLVINTDMTICGGHGRLKVLKELNIQEVDCYVPEVQLNADEFKELNIRLNKNIAGEFDFDVLANHFETEDLKEWGFLDWEISLSENKDTETEIDTNNLINKNEIICPKCKFIFENGI